MITCVLHGLFKIERAVYDVEEATAVAFEIIIEHKVIMFFCSVMYCTSTLCVIPLSSLLIYAFAADDQI